MALRELYDSRPNEGDLRGFRAIRRFLVNGQSTDLAINESGMPQIGSRFFFGDKELIAVAYRVEGTVTPRASVVEWYYDDSELVRHVSQGISRGEEVYPIYVPEVYGNSVTQLGQVQTHTRWVLKELRFERSDEIYRVTIQMPVWGLPEQQQVRKQLGHIHEFFATSWLYNGVQTESESSINPPPRTTVTHSWVSDPGFDGLRVPLFPPPLTPDNTIIPIRTTNFTVDDRTRLPFESYQAIPIQGLDPMSLPTGRPRLTMMSTKIHDPLGFATLPGNPILDP